MRYMQRNWDTWDDDDNRWWAVYEILDVHEHESSTEALRRGVAACVEALRLIGGTNLDCGFDVTDVAKLDLAIAELSAVSARLLVAQYIPESGSGHGADAYAAVLNG